jgi:hypothetical protein
MKHSLFFLLFCWLGLVNLVYAEDSITATTHTHDGFFLSLNAGLAGSSVNMDASGNNSDNETTKFRGGGIMADMKIGGFVAISNFFGKIFILQRKPQHKTALESAT